MISRPLIFEMGKCERLVNDLTHHMDEVAKKPAAASALFPNKFEALLLQWFLNICEYRNAVNETLQGIINRGHVDKH